MQSIAIVNGSRRNDGITVSNRLFYKVLKEAGYDVKWYQIVDSPNLSDYYVDGEIIKGVTQFGYPISNGLNRLIFLTNKSKKIKSDLIYLSDPTLIGLFKGLGNTIVKFHDFRPLTRFNDRILAKIMFSYIVKKLRQVNFALFNSEFTFTDARKLGIMPKKGFMIPETVQWEVQKDHVEVSLRNLNNGYLTFTYIATDRKYKNIDLFLRLSNVEILGIKIRFLLVSNMAKRKAEKVSREFPRVSIISNVTDIKSIYKQTDVLLHPSLYEGFGRPVIEAMSFGIPVLVSNIKPLKEIVINEANLCIPNDIECWIDKILNITKPKVYRDAAQYSLERFENYSYEKFKQRILSMMKYFDQTTS